MKRYLIMTMLALPAVAQEERFAVKDEARFYALVPRDAQVEMLGNGFKHTEGPVWIGTGDDGFLVFTASNREQKQWSPASGFKTFRQPSNGTNGSALDPEGRMVVCEQTARRVARVAPDGSSIPLADNFEGKKFNAPNDLAIRSDGTIWFTDPRYGEETGPAEVDGAYVYRIDPDGKVSIATKDCTFPNGICLSPDEKILYVGQGGPGTFVRAYDIAADGSLTNGRQIGRVRKGVPDGLKCDEQGNLYITTGEGVEVWTSTGEHLGTIRAQPRPANVGFGGPGRKTLFITAKDCLFRMPVNIPGPERRESPSGK